jgi:hypothetical protein
MFVLMAIPAFKACEPLPMLVWIHQPNRVFRSLARYSASPECYILRRSVEFLVCSVLYPLKDEIGVLYYLYLYGMFIIINVLRVLY